MRNWTKTNLKQKVWPFPKESLRHISTCARRKKEFVLSKQLLRSGTSIGANIAEAQYGSSRKDFLNKLYIALKECAETLYWLELLYECDYFTATLYRSLLADCEELRKILSSITKTTRDSID